MNVLLSSNMTM